MLACNSSLSSLFVLLSQLNSVSLIMSCQPLLELSPALHTPYLALSPTIVLKAVHPFQHLATVCAIIHIWETLCLRCTPGFKNMVLAPLLVLKDFWQGLSIIGVRWCMVSVAQVATWVVMIGWFGCLELQSDVVFHCCQPKTLGVGYALWKTFSANHSCGECSAELAADLKPVGSFWCELSNVIVQ